MAQRGLFSCSKRHAARLVGVDERPAERRAIGDLHAPEGTSEVSCGAASVAIVREAANVAMIRLVEW